MSLKHRARGERQMGETGWEIWAQITKDLEEQVKELECDSLKEAGPVFRMSRSDRERPARLEARLTMPGSHHPSLDKLSLSWTSLEKTAQGHVQHSPPRRWREQLCSLDRLGLKPTYQVCDLRQVMEPL